MVLTITLTANNIINQSGTNQNNLLRYSFPTTAVFDNHEIALTAVSIYYAWFNIDKSLYNNNTFYYYWLYEEGNPFSLTSANPYTTVLGITYYYDSVADLTYTQYSNHIFFTVWNQGSPTTPPFWATCRLRVLEGSDPLLMSEYTARTG